MFRLLPPEPQGPPHSRSSPILTGAPGAASSSGSGSGRGNGGGGIKGGAASGLGAGAAGGVGVEEVLLEVLGRRAGNEVQLTLLLVAVLRGLGALARTVR